MEENPLNKLPGFMGTENAPLKQKIITDELITSELEKRGYLGKFILSIICKLILI